ncbi:MAG: response regulator [Thermodesulfobacteriota bacterium]
MHIYSILLIDPFRNLVNAYQILLREEGYEVESSLNLEEAYSYILKKSYSIILLEYLYPYEATEEFIRKIKRDSPETYLIMIANALIDGETYERLFNAGLDEFILKPYSPDKILVHIKKGLKERERIIEIEKLKRLNLVDPISEKLNR